ncbi:MAG: sugar ABC transporter permease [Clostridia bacterium]|nr:sugar ABC transporter permease [Clostridia bacterium]
MKARNPNPKVAGVLSALIAGAGQVYNGQRRKALAFMCIEAIFLVLAITTLRDPLYGLVTLNPVGRFVDSRHILLVGILSALAVGAYAWFHAANVADAVKTAQFVRLCGRLPEEVSAGSDWHAFLRSAAPYFYIAPAMALTAFVILIPLLFNVALAFTNYNLYHCPPAGRFDWVGFSNFRKLLQSGSSWRGQLDTVLAWNLAYAALGTVFAFLVGLVLALTLQNRQIRLRRMFRTILMLPWAIPSAVTIMVFFGLFNTSFGPINGLLKSIGLSPISWFQDNFWARVSVLLTHVWIAFPFNMSVISAALQSVPNEVYEAARVDGASRWDSFSRITFPLVMSVIAPVAVLMFAGNFNNFGIIYLLTSGGPPVPGSRGAGATDILMTWVYNVGFRQLQWAYASSLALLVFAFVVIMSMTNFKLSGVLKQLKQEEQ